MSLLKEAVDTNLMIENMQDSFVSKTIYIDMTVDSLNKRNKLTCTSNTQHIP